MKQNNEFVETVTIKLHDYESMKALQEEIKKDGIVVYDYFACPGLLYNNWYVKTESQAIENLIERNKRLEHELKVCSREVSDLKYQIQQNSNKQWWQFWK